ncbi:MAG: L,D-transpeptidase family protein [Gammaproteobacteria bacterium]
MNDELRIDIDLSRQRLTLTRAGSVLMDCAVSTARNGPGEIEGSECTPRGAHVVAEKIGAGCAPGTVFVARRPTGEIYSPDLRARHPGRDWILTRILWLAGCEPGRNQGGNVDSKARYIYIHGAPDDVPMGVPGSRGCIRMRNAQVIELFDRVSEGVEVHVHD